MCVRITIDLDTTFVCMCQPQAKLPREGAAAMHRFNPYAWVWQQNSVVTGKLVMHVLIVIMWSVRAIGRGK